MRLKGTRKPTDGDTTLGSVERHNMLPPAPTNGLRCPVAVEPVSPHPEASTPMPTTIRSRCAALLALSLLLLQLGLSATSSPAAAAEVRDPSLWPFASTSPWNMPIGSGARFTTSADPRIATLRAGGARVNANEGYSHPVVQARDSDPTATFQDISISSRSRTAKVPTTATPASGTDGHLHVISPDKRTVTETWVAQRKSSTLLTARRVERNDLHGSGILEGGTRAYGGSAIAGLVRTHELRGAAIPHAVAIALNPDQLRRGHVWPANAEDGSNSYSGTIPMGTLFAIPGSVDVESLGLNREALAVARALQDYGAYVVDQGAPFVVYVEQGADPAHVANVAKQLRGIKDLLQVVTNNGPSSVGGGGTPRVPMAPPLSGGGTAPTTPTTTPVLTTPPPTTPPPTTAPGPIAVAGTPDAPRSVTASAVVAGKATVRWAPPSSDGGSAITGYRVSRDGVAIGGTGAWSTVVKPGARSYAFYRLRAGETYALTVEAINAKGTGASASASTDGTTGSGGTVVAKAPSAPGAVAATRSTSSGTATLTLSAPADGGSPITGYRVARDGSDTSGYGAWSTVLPASARSFTFYSLVPSSAYRLQVEAINAVGSGPAAVAVR
jgi:hypothetical protein